MDKYLAERDKYVMPSLEDLLLEALAGHFSPSTGNSVTLYTEDIAVSIRNLCGGYDIIDENLAEAGTQRIGLLLGRLNFQKSSTHGARRSWIIDRGLLEQHCEVHEINIAPSMETPMPSPELAWAGPVADEEVEVEAPLPW